MGSGDAAGSDVPGRLDIGSCFAPEPGFCRIRASIAYDGTGFHGFAAQPGLCTVAGVIQSAIESIFAYKARITCAGRTDAGVHAIGQVIHFDIPVTSLANRWAVGLVAGEHLLALQRSLDKIVGPLCSISNVTVAPIGFDARHSAIYRRYHYDLDCSVSPDPRRRHLAWHLDERPDLTLLRLAADPLIGEHNFAGFCRQVKRGEAGPIIRRVTEARWLVGSDDMLRFEIQAKAFCHQMVRSLVGTLVAIGQGRATPHDIVQRLASGSRQGAPPVAPAHGLCLVEVGYPSSLW